MRIKLPALAWFGVLYTLNVILALAVPPNPASLAVLHVSLPIYRIIIFTVLIPYGLAWGAAFYAYEKLGDYTRLIEGTIEGRGFSHIVNGLRVLAWGLILTTTLSLILGIIRNVEPSFMAAPAIINRYATLAVTLIAFVMIQNGTFILVESVRARRSKANIRALIVVVTVIGAFLVQLAAYNQHTNGNPYYMPFYLLMITVLIPYISAWAVGLLGTSELGLYARKVNGVLYQQALQLVANGLTIVIVVSIISQYLTAIFARKTMFSLGALLVVIYACLVIEAGGLALLAFGAKQLKKIEDA